MEAKVGFTDADVQKLLAAAAVAKKANKQALAMTADLLNLLTVEIVKRAQTEAGEGNEITLEALERVMPKAFLDLF
jgi:hypothetical protein